MPPLLRNFKPEDVPTNASNIIWSRDTLQLRANGVVLGEDRFTDLQKT